MKVVEKGHVYDLASKHDEKQGDGNTLVFVNLEKGREHNGTTTQEVLRALIDRTRHCNNCLPHPNNERIVYHLRMALVLHEARALERKTEKDELMPEYVTLGDDRHFDLTHTSAGPHATPALEPYRQDWDRPCNHEAK